MKAVCVIPKGTFEGNLIWPVTTIYPSDLFNRAYLELEQANFYIEELEDIGGIAFRSNLEATDAFHQIQIIFRWIDISFFDDESKIDFDKVGFHDPIVVLPVSRLLIEDEIVTDHICLFPPERVNIENAILFDSRPFAPGEDYVRKSNVLHKNDLRDYITSLTNLNIEIFQKLPVIIFSIKLPYADFFAMDQIGDTDLIKRCADRGEELMDLLRFFHSDYTLPEALPAKVGIWNDRYSAIYIHYPTQNIAHIQSREVELKSFIKGVGMDVYNTDNINIHPLMNRSINELQKITKYTLKLNSSIMGSEDETMKFVQIMTLFEFIGNPYEYDTFKNTKSKFIGILAKNKTHYHELNDRFKELTGGKEPGSNSGLRTQIVHVGKSIYDLIPNSGDRKTLFRELHGYIYTLILDMMLSDTETWTEYEKERVAKRDKLIK